jgi:RecA/RadA recombinase
MKSAARERLEALLGAEKLAGTLMPAWAQRPHVDVRSTGVPWLDAQLGGGWRQGEISELVGARSTGKTSVLMATLAAATADGGVVALVDTLDRLEPGALAAAGADLTRVLWVRGAPMTVEAARPDRIDDAVLRAIRAFDLILRAGGFAVVALDVSDVPSRMMRRLPWATWRRLAQANEGRPTVGLLVGDGPMGRSARGISFALHTRAIWVGTSDQSRRMVGFERDTDKSQGP